MKLSYLDLMTTDPSYNLAMEQYVFDCLPRDRMYFMLWQNDNAINLDRDSGCALLRPGLYGRLFCRGGQRMAAVRHRRTELKN